MTKPKNPISQEGLKCSKCKKVGISIIRGKVLCREHYDKQFKKKSRRYKK